MEQKKETIKKSAASKSATTEAKQSEIYREIFFAGFRTSDAGAQGSSAATIFTHDFVFSFFRQYGEIHYFTYDEERGAGSVVFVDGQIAERCYVAVHLSWLPCTEAEARAKMQAQLRAKVGRDSRVEVLDEEDEDDRWAARRAGKDDVLLFLEFAQGLPFVNPLMLLWETSANAGATPATAKHRKTDLFAYHAGLLSRQMLRYLPPSVVLAYATLENAQELQRAAHVQHACNQQYSFVKKGTAEWVVGVVGENSEPAYPSILLHHDFNGFKMADAQTDGGLPEQKSILPPELGRRLWVLLRPESAKENQNRTQVRVIDLWWFFYQQYIVHKTRPEATRITDLHNFGFAQRPSSWQEMHTLKQVSESAATSDVDSAASTLARLIHDDVYHNTYCYLCYKLKYRNDPTYVSLIRDVYTAKIKESVAAFVNEKEKAVLADLSDPSRASDAEFKDKNNTVLFTVLYAVARRCSMDDQVILYKTIAPAEGRRGAAPPKQARVSRKQADQIIAAEESWLRLPLTEAVANLIKNIYYLQKIRRREIDPKTGNDFVRPGDSAAAGAKKDKKEDEVLRDYPTGTIRQEEEMLFMEITQTVDGFAPNGAAVQLYSLCEHPQLFKGSRGHIGYDELHPPVPIMTYVNAMWVPLIVLALTSWGFSYIGNKLAPPSAPHGGVNETNASASLNGMNNRQRRRAAGAAAGSAGGAAPRPTSATGNGAAAQRAASGKPPETHFERMRKIEEEAKRRGIKFKLEGRGDL